MNEDFSVTLYKPGFKIDYEEITNSAITIRLPAMDIIDDPDKAAYIVKKVAISADPLTNPNQCTVMVIYDAGMKLAYIRPAKDTAWSYVDLGKGFADVIHCGNKFYVLTVKFGELISFEETDDERPFNLSPKLIKTAQLERVAGNRYLVELNGKLLQVERRLVWDTRRRWRKYKVFSRLTEAAVVYELDFNSMSWIEIRDIGDFALFLGDNSSMSVIASNFDGCKPNLIYFTHDQDPLHSSRDVVNDFGVYDISTGVMDLNFDMDAHSLGKMMRRIPIWIEPRNINQS